VQCVYLDPTTEYAEIAVWITTMVQVTKRVALAAIQRHLIVELHEVDERSVANRGTRGGQPNQEPGQLAKLATAGQVGSGEKSGPLDGAGPNFQPLEP